MDTQSVLPPPPAEEGGRIGFLGAFTSPALENDYRKQHFRDDLWLSRFLISTGMLRVALFLVADYHHFGVGPLFWRLLAGRLLFVALSAWILVGLGRAASPAAADRLFTGWGLLLIASTALLLAARPPSNNTLLLMSFGMIVIGYCLTPLPLSRQAALTLTWSAAALCLACRADGATLGMVAAAYALSHLFGGVTSWRLNHRRREMFLGSLREARLRASFEAAMAEVRTLRGLVCICAWCKRVRDGAQTWETVEKYVASRTHASFSHGICPDCMQSQVREMAHAHS